MNEMTVRGEIANLPVHRLQSRPVSVFDDADSFDFGQRMAKALASSNLLPAQFQNNLPNCLILIDIARPMKVSLFTVASHLNIIHGRPTWSAQFVIATINSCGLFAPLRFEWRGTEGQDNWACRATAVELATDTVLCGSWISIKMAKDEGWYARPGSKWKNMPEQMLIYRAASFFGKVYASHILSGMPTSEEFSDERSNGEPRVVGAGTPEPVPAAAEPVQGTTPLAAVNAEVRATRTRRRREAAAVIDAATGEDAPPGAVDAPAAAQGMTPAAAENAAPAPANAAAAAPAAAPAPEQGEAPASTYTPPPLGDNDIF